MEINSFGEQLKFWRTYRGVSQMKLATELNMSSRNLSFLETGRSRPTRSTVTRLTDYLDIPHQEKARLFTAAGIKYSVTDSPTTTEASFLSFKQVIRQLLEHHNPYPALVYNAFWDVIDLNCTASILFDYLNKGDNIIEKCFLNEQWIERDDNSDKVLLSLFHEMRDDLNTNKDDRFLSLFRGVEKKINSFKHNHPPINPAICYDCVFNGVNLKLTSMITRFRPLNSLDLQGLKLELVLPNDLVTESFLKNLKSFHLN
ncbi:helix-turn-helix domain-containing protein [Marinomonas transparens]|uniref:Helix-turn-helix domain-containing protein n=1 Tax=Marinomonas transparens TaxID=2795388 RepID=A0A934JPK3_9GAMM|nr:helix-turn-helix domain-containing protein [Marinomonas transparens]MBJ7539596.1 helix-turn-helix domain-containing protein [Marinomonas transparens]